MDPIIHACRLMQTTHPTPLTELAQAVGLSASHFQRRFKEQVGITPRQYAAALRDERVRRALASGSGVLQAILDAGFQSPSRFYEGVRARLGMQPSQYQDKGRQARIHLCLGSCSLGSFLVAVSEVGVCAIDLGEDPQQLIEHAQKRFANAQILGPDATLDALVAQVVGLLENPAVAHALPLDIRGTVFQRQVWQVLRDIPAGTTLSYAQVADRIGRPSSMRAVAQACAANTLAVAVPCHRVVRSDGALSGYRWGVERKKQLLDREAAKSGVRAAAVIGG